MKSYAEDLAWARRLVVSRAIDLRTAKADLEAIRAIAEQDVYAEALAEQEKTPPPTDAKGKALKRPHPLGENEQDRTRAITLALGDHDGYSQASHNYDKADADHKHAETELEILLDQRREWEWKTRADLVRVLDMRSIGRDGGQDQGGTFSTEILDHAATGAAAGAASYEPPF